jgi:HD-like signal output (HDOD) protein
VHCEPQASRAAALARRLTQSGFHPETASEVCAAFDVAAEFAACEGQSLRDALVGFFADAESAGTEWGDAQLALRKVLRWNDNPWRLPAGLPVLPSAAMKLLRQHDETATVDDLEAVAGGDPVMAARLLSVANSALFGSRYGITVIREAIQRLGIPESRKTLLAACFSGLHISKPLQDFWAHSQLVADFSWQFAGLCGVDRGTAYAAGLLHDMGRLVFLSGDAGRRAAEREWRAAGFPAIYAETLAHGCDHATAGTELLAAWKLPQELVEAVALHHRPESTPNTLAHVLFLAEDLTTLVEGNQPEDLWSAMRRRIALDKSEIPPHAVEGIVAAFGGPDLKLIC